MIVAFQKWDDLAADTCKAEMGQDCESVIVVEIWGHSLSATEIQSPISEPLVVAFWCWRSKPHSLAIQSPYPRFIMLLEITVKEFELSTSVTLSNTVPNEG
ncbi:hypothetical protein QC762_0045090 [Podospora pseudocomata]|uniref:Uncharacterized protein n=1 Tax=Podospora pseudocomata TaxID=2093779 RepID=A0ABR0GNM6_9PEZI|nr:hypothetical protein QC762_0045090 [Podospora pseudocomata]